MALLKRLVLGADPAGQLNLRITLGGQVGYVANLLLVWYLVRNGLMDPALAWPVILVVATSMLGFYLMLRLGWSRRFKDPSLTVPQMINASAFSAVGYVVAPQVHIALLMPVAVTLAYSVFALRGRQVVIVQSVTIAIFVVTSAVMSALQPAHYPLTIEVCVIGMLALTVLMLTWTGSRVADLRARQMRQREELADALSRIEAMAGTDTLTGLPNRRRMNALLAHHAGRVQRDGAPLTVALIDLDHFKQVNDVHGHAAGDEVLRAFARTTSSLLPPTDVLARWGGEEFLLLSTTPADAVRRVLDEVRRVLDDGAGAAGIAGLTVRFSAGVAQHRADRDVNETVRLADEALYGAKRGGRSQTRLAAEPPAGECAAASALPRRPLDAPGGIENSTRPLRAATPLPETRATAPGGGAPDSVLADEDQDQPGARVARWGWLLGHDVRQRTFVARNLMGFPPYLFSLMGVVYLWQTDYMPADVAWKTAVGLGATPLLWYAAVRAGWTRTLRDPAITLAHVLSGIVWSALLYATTAQAHAIQLIALVTVMTVAVCNMNRRQAWLACGVAMVVMSAVMAAMTALQPGIYVPRVQVANWALMMADLPILLLMGGQLEKLRDRMRSQRSELKEAVRRLSELATHDELTGLVNRARMTEMLEHYKRRNAETGEAFALILIDLDHFKRINDRHGHAVGDQVLQRFAELAVATMRQVDVVARWGGEEFLILCPCVSAEQAMIGLERLRRAFAILEITPALPHLRATFSAGVAQARADESFDATVARADAALYAAKGGGRNRACLAHALQ